MTNSISAAMITVITGSQISRFDPQTFTPDASALANGVLIFPLTCDSSIFATANANSNSATVSSVTVVVSNNEDPISLENVSVAVGHYDAGTHKVTGKITNNGNDIKNKAK